MNKIIWTIISGIIFGMGLMISGMSNPDKVISFLDLTGQWDPSLAFVMIGAITVTAIGYRVINLMNIVNIAKECSLKTAIDKPLIIGAALFGIGWGIIGICPGPAFTLIPTAPLEALYTLAPMFVGLLIGSKVKERLGI